jgi:hypothetical protein
MSTRLSLHVGDGAAGAGLPDPRGQNRPDFPVIGVTGIVFLLPEIGVELFAEFVEQFLQRLVRRKWRLSGCRLCILPRGSP